MIMFSPQTLIIELGLDTWQWSTRFCIPHSWELIYAHKSLREFGSSCMRQLPRYHVPTYGENCWGKRMNKNSNTTKRWISNHKTLSMNAILKIIIRRYKNHNHSYILEMDYETSNIITNKSEIHFKRIVKMKEWTNYLQFLTMYK